MPAIASVAEFVAAMRRCDLPERGEWEPAAHAAPDAETLARELARAGLLTSLQSRQLIAGRGDDLIIGPFLLLELLGSGGMGQVFKARHRLMRRVVALKVMLPALGEDAEIVARFEQEIRSVAQLAHPNIVTAHHAESGPRGLVLAMEYCDGRDLGQAVREGGPFAVARACDCAAQAAAGLSAAHAAGLVHRDIKPSNLLLTTDGAVKILDFGLARFHQSEDTDRLTRTGAAMGTPDFMAPEQARDSAAVDIRGDVYSLGCTLYYLLAGRVPFPGGTPWYKISRHQSESPEPVEVLRPQVPAALAEVVRTMMARDPIARYQTPAEVIAALAPFRVAATTTTVHTVDALPPTAHVIPPGAELPRVVSVPAGSATVPYAVPESSPFDFPSTPVPSSHPSAPPHSSEVSSPVRRSRRRRRAIWPRRTGAVAGLLLVATVVALTAFPRPRAPAPEAQPLPPAVGLPPTTLPNKNSPVPVGSIDLSPLVPGNGANETIAAHRVAFHPRTPEILAVARGQGWNPVHGGVEVWNVTTRKRVFVAGGEKHPPVYAVAFSGDGQFLAFAAGSPEAPVSRAAVTVLNADSWEQRCTFETDSDGVLALSFTHGKHSHLVVGTQVVYEKGPPSGGLEVWAGNGDWRKPTRVIDRARPRERVDLVAPVTGLAMNPYGLNNFAAAGLDATARLWQAETAGTQSITARSEYEVPKGTGAMTDVAWSADGRLLAAVTARAVPAAPDRTGRRVLVWGSPANPVKPWLMGGPEMAYDFTCLAFLPEGTGSAALVTGDAEGRLRVWDLNPPVPSERQPARDLKLFERAISAVAVSPDGKTLVVAGEGLGTTYQLRFVPLADLRDRGK